MNVKAYANGHIRAGRHIVPAGEDRRIHDCPDCGKASAYVWHQDRFFHIDGTANRHCWLAILRGDTPTTSITRTVPAGDCEDWSTP